MLDDILDAARWTGSAKNAQPWELIVVEDRSTLAELATLGQWAGHLDGAKLAIVLVMNNEPLTGPLDEGRLAETIMLAAWSHGVGSCIATIFPEENSRRAKTQLGVPADRRLITAISLGYPADASATRVSRDLAGGLSTMPMGRRSRAAFVSWERFGERQSASD